MHINLKIEHARRLMDKLHERNRKQGEDLKRLCALLTELTQDHAAACGADDGVVTMAVAPKDD